MTKASATTIITTLLASCMLMGCQSVSEKASAASPQATKQSSTQAPATQDDKAQSNAVPDKVLVYYFHFTRRCHTCLGIQATIEKTIKERFAAEAASATLAFQDLNLEQPENNHFSKDFNLGFSAMVVVALKGQTMLKWENADQVWELAHNEPALTEYIEKRIRAYVDLLRKN